MASFDEDYGYKQIRNYTRFGLVVAWLVGWYWYLDVARAHEIAARKACIAAGGATGLGCQAGDWMNMSDLSLSFSMLGVCITAPFLFFPARMIARQIVRARVAQELRQEQAARAAEERQMQHESQQRMVANAAGAAKTQQQINRSEIIQKLGSITDLIELMGVERDDGRRMNIRLSVAQALRELAAKYDIQTLRTLIQSDHAASVIAQSVLNRLEDSPLSNLAEIPLLRSAASDIT